MSTVTQGKGYKAKLLVDFETTYGQEPGSKAAVQVPFDSFTVKGETGLVEYDTITGDRSRPKVDYGNEDVAGEVTVPLDARNVGYWLKALLGSPTTTGSGPYTHVYKVGDTVPSMVMELQHVDRARYRRFVGAVVNELRLDTDAASEGGLQLVMGLMAAAATWETVVYDATPTTWTLERFLARQVAEIPAATQIGGGGVGSSWSGGTITSVKSLVWHDSKLYAGVLGSSGDAEVWEYTPSTGAWTKIGGDGVNSGWTGAEEVVLCAYAGDLYAGLGRTEALVWQYTSGTWSQVGGDALNSSWANLALDMVSAMVVHDSKLVVGTGDDADESQVWEWNGTAWTQIGGQDLNSSWPDADDHLKVNSLASNGDGRLWASLGSGSGLGEVWEYNGTAWTKIGGDGINNGWASSSIVYDVVWHRGNLYAVEADDVWEWNGSLWTQIGGNDVNNGWSNGDYDFVMTLYSDGLDLYAGMDDGTEAADLWRYREGRWHRVVTAGESGVWSTDRERVTDLVSYDGVLYAGFGSGANTDPVVWKVDVVVIDGATSMSLSMNNGIEAHRLLGGGGKVGVVTPGRYRCDGEVTVLFEDETLLDGAERTVRLRFENGAHSLEWKFPEVLLEKGDAAIDGPGGTLMSLPLMGYDDDNSDNSSVVVTLTNDVSSYA